MGCLLQLPAPALVWLGALVLSKDQGAREIARAGPAVERAAAGQVGVEFCPAEDAPCP